MCVYMYIYVGMQVSNPEKQSQLWKQIFQVIQEQKSQENIHRVVSEEKESEGERELRVGHWIKPTFEVWEQ